MVWGQFFGAVAGGLAASFGASASSSIDNRTAGRKYDAETAGLHRRFPGLTPQELAGAQNPNFGNGAGEEAAQQIGAQQVIARQQQQSDQTIAQMNNSASIQVAQIQQQSAFGSADRAAAAPNKRVSYQNQRDYAALELDFNKSSLVQVEIDTAVVNLDQTRFDNAIATMLFKDPKTFEDPVNQVRAAAVLNIVKSGGGAAMKLLGTGRFSFLKGKDTEVFEKWQ